MDTMLAALIITAFICGMYRNVATLPPPFQGNFAAAVVEDEHSDEDEHSSFDGLGPSVDSIDAFTGVNGNLGGGKL